jgi:uncharacterized MAPEG superfamily protein
VRSLAYAYAFLALQFIVTVFLQVYRRVKHETPINREDPGFKGDRRLLNSTNTQHYTSKDKEDHPVLRVQRVLNNNIETWLPFLLASLSFAFSVYVANKPTWITLASTLVLAFPALRLSHTVFYLAHIQPLRTLAFVLASTCTIGLAVLSGVNLSR